MYDPKWNGEVVGYAVKYLANNAWRVTPEHELDDLFQESYLLFVRLQERYDFKTASHFMAMWKRCLVNMIGNMAAVRTCRREVHLRGRWKTMECRPDVSTEWDRHLDEAPEYVHRLVSEAENRGTKRRCRFRRLSSGNRETTNEHLCRVANVPNEVPLRRLFECWLTGEKSDIM